MVERSSREHPRLTISGAYSPPFRELSGLEQEEEVARINSSGAQIVFVGLGCPKQELWMARNKGKINAVMIGAVGFFRLCRASPAGSRLDAEIVHGMVVPSLQGTARSLETLSGDEFDLSRLDDHRDAAENPGCGKILKQAFPGNFECPTRSRGIPGGHFPLGR